MHGAWGASGIGVTMHDTSDPFEMRLCGLTSCVIPCVEGTRPVHICNMLA